MTRILPRKWSVVLILAVVLGASFSLFVHGYWLMDMFSAGSKRLLLATILGGIIGAVGYFLLLSWMGKTFSALPFRQRMGLIGLGLLIGIFLFFTDSARQQYHDRYVTFLLPTHTLQISALPGQAPEQISIQWIGTSLGDVSFDNIAQQGWKRNGNVLILTNENDNRLEWTGITGGTVRLLLKSSSTARVRLLWDGSAEIVSLPGGEYPIRHAFKVPFFASEDWLFGLRVLTFTVLSLAIFLAAWTRRADLLKALGKAVDERPGRVSAREWAVVLGVIVLALLLRVPRLGNLFPVVDEYYQLIAAKQFAQGASLASVYQRSLWLVTVPVSIAFRLFGYELWAARLVVTVFNVLAIIPLYLLTRKINRPVAILSCLLFATSPWVITFSRIVREYAVFPFYFYWIIYGMIVFIQKFPNPFVFTRDWKTFLKPDRAILALTMTLPPIYALFIDHSSFVMILIAYLVFGLFLLTRMDVHNKGNLVFTGVLMSAGLLLAWLAFVRAPDLMIGFNSSPLGYFFPNPPQQWYFGRPLIVTVTGLFASIFFAFRLRRVNSIPLFMLTLYLCFLSFFLFSSIVFFKPRHLLTTQLWYPVIIAFGLFILWTALQTLLPSNRKMRLLLAFVLAFAFGKLVFNEQQVLFPITSNNPDMPVTRDYVDDLSTVHAFMLEHVEKEDVLISTVYPLYVTWKGEPIFQAAYRITIHTPEYDVQTVIRRYPSGWLVIDQARLEDSLTRFEELAEKDHLEYMGLFNNQHVWYWKHNLP